MRVTVRDLMTLDPVTVDANATIGETINLILNRAVGEVYVRDADGLLLGAVSDYAVLKARLNRTAIEQPISSIMSRALVVLNPNATLESVAGSFRDSCHGQVAVVEDGRVIGQLSRRDVLRAMLVLDEIRTDAERHRRFEDGWPHAAKPHVAMQFSDERRMDGVVSGA